VECKANAQFKHIAIHVPAVAKSFHPNADGLKKKKSQQVTTKFSPHQAGQAIGCNAPIPNNSGKN
jgi:hypothetical protein